MSRLTTYVYDLSGNIVEKDLANGTKEVRAHDGRNRISTLKNETAGNSPIAGYAYGYDLAGNVRQVSEIYTSGSLSSRTITNGYDGVYRLTQEAIATTGGGTTVTTTYAYDKGHNRTSKAISGGATTSYVLGDGTNGAGANQIVSETTGSLTTAYAYDNNGNRSSRTVGSTATTTGTVTNGSPTITAIPSTAAVAVGMVVSGTSITAGTRVTAIVSSSSVTMSANASGSHTGEAITFTAQTDASSYDDENRLLSLDYETASTGTGTYTYAYDYRTRRVTRTEPGPVTTNIIFNGGVSIEEYTSSAGSPTVEYIRGRDYGGGVGGLEYSVRSSTPSFNFYDSRGDVTTKTNGSGTVTYQTGYEAFGKQTVSSGTTPTDRQRASTKEQDPTGLLNEGFRYRDPATGTFLTRDPLGFKAGLNNYTYVKQNPWTRFDPEGLDVNESTKHPSPPPPPPPSTKTVTQPSPPPPTKQTAQTNQPATTSNSDAQEKSPSQAPDPFAGLPSLTANMQTQDQKNSQAANAFGVDPQDPLGTSGGPAASAKSSASSTTSSNNKSAEDSAEAGDKSRQITNRKQESLTLGLVIGFSVQYSTNLDGSEPSLYIGIGPEAEFDYNSGVTQNVGRTSGLTVDASVAIQPGLGPMAGASISNNFKGAANPQSELYNGAIFGIGAGVSVTAGWTFNW